MLWYIPVVLFLLWFWQYLFSSMSVETIPYSQFKQYLAQERSKTATSSRTKSRNDRPQGLGGDVKNQRDPGGKKDGRGKRTRRQDDDRKTNLPKNSRPRNRRQKRTANEKQPPPETTTEKRRPKPARSSRRAQAGGTREVEARRVRNRRPLRRRVDKAFQVPHRPRGRPATRRAVGGRPRRIQRRASRVALDIAVRLDPADRLSSGVLDFLSRRMGRPGRR